MGKTACSQQLTAELEQLVDIRNVSSPLSKSMQRSDFDPLELEQYNELNTVTHRLVEAATDATNWAAPSRRIWRTGRFTGGSGPSAPDNQEAVLRTRMVPIQTVAPRLQRSVRQTCRLVDQEGGTGGARRRHADGQQCLERHDRSADAPFAQRGGSRHRTPGQRQHLGKPPVGRSNSTSGARATTSLFVVRMTGRGWTWRRFGERDGARPDRRRPVTDRRGTGPIDPVARFFHRGEATQTSGRGIGMDMVHSDCWI